MAVLHRYALAVVKLVGQRLPLLILLFSTYHHFMHQEHYDKLDL